MLVMPFGECVKILFCLKERPHSVNLKFHLDLALKTFLHFPEGYMQVSLRIQRGTDCGKQMGMMGCDRVFVIQFERSDKCFFQFRQEMKRSA